MVTLLTPASFNLAGLVDSNHEYPPSDARTRISHYLGFARVHEMGEVNDDLVTLGPVETMLNGGMSSLRCPHILLSGSLMS